MNAEGTGEPTDGRCPLCGGTARPTRTDLVFVAGEITVRVEGVAAWACGGCGETFVDGPLGVRIGDEVADMLALLQTDRAEPGDRATAPRAIVLAATDRPALDAA